MEQYLNVMGVKLINRWEITPFQRFYLSFFEAKTFIHPELQIMTTYKYVFNRFFIIKMEPLNNHRINKEIN